MQYLKSTQSRCFRNEAFTLIELLITMIIVGILAAISVNNFFEYKRSAYRAELLTLGHNLATGAEAMYADQINANWAYDFETRSQITSGVPGITALPDYVGGYARTGWKSDGHGWRTSIRLCSLKLPIESNKQLTFRYRWTSVEGLTHQGVEHNSHITQAECETRSA